MAKAPSTVSEEDKGILLSLLSRSRYYDKTDKSKRASFYIKSEGNLWQRFFGIRSKSEKVHDKIIGDLEKFISSKYQEYKKVKEATGGRVNLTKAKEYYYLIEDFGDAVRTWHVFTNHQVKLKGLPSGEVRPKTELEKIKESVEAVGKYVPERSSGSERENWKILE